MADGFEQYSIGLKIPTSTPGRRSLCDRIGEHVNPTILMAEHGRSILWMSCPGKPESVFETRIVLQLPLIPM